jgi:GPH family glycoside/pentoside/hexuronide:cation symporter
MMAIVEIDDVVPPPVPGGAARLKLGAQVSYGVGQIAGQVFRDLPSLLLLFFMTNALGVAPALAGVAIFVPKLVWGIVCDVGVGVLSDRLKARIARRWWLLAGALLSPLAMILLFHVQAGDQGMKAAYVAAAFSLYMMVFASFSVPYLAIAGELSSDPHQRTMLMAWRLVFTAAGLLIAGSFAPIFIQSQGGGQIAYEKLSIVLAVICPIALLIAFFGAGRASAQSDHEVDHRIAAPVSAGFPIREALSALAAPRFCVLAGANLIQLVGSGMAYASMLYFLTYNLGRADAFRQIGIISILASATIVFAQPLWVGLAKRFGKKRVYIASSLFYGANSLAWGLTAPLGIWPSYGLGVLLGITNSGWTLMGFSMVSDIAGEGRAGLYSSIWVAADKIGFALGGTLLVGLILAVFGFDAQRAVMGLAQPASAVTAVLIAFSLAPALLSAVAAAVFAKWGR